MAHLSDNGSTPSSYIGLGLAQVGRFADPDTVIEMAAKAEARGRAQEGRHDIAGVVAMQVVEWSTWRRSSR